MSLGYQNNPIVLIREKKGKFKRETWIEYDEVVAYENCGHILRDLAVHEYNHKAVSTWIGLEAQRLRRGTQPKAIERVVIGEDQDTEHLGLRMIYIHIKR